ncbi:MAG: hypothetical protein JOZ54_00910 [Acidobacteria bacterium]|nr:hypothetical protein [Acidobacteriota bacterium]
MRNFILPLLLTVSLTSPLLAFERGEVILKTAVEDAQGNGTWEVYGGFEDWSYLGRIDAVALIFKPVPFNGDGDILAPAPNQVFFDLFGTIHFWNGELQRTTQPGLGYSELFHDDAQLGEMAPMRNGHFLLAERSSTRDRGVKLIELDLNGIVAEYPLPGVVDAAKDRVLGAQHLDLLADQCTVLYSLGDDDPDGYHVRRYNLCTRQAEADFGAPVAGQQAGTIRQLPDGDVLVSTAVAIFRYSPQGSVARVYPIEGITHIALSPEGDAVWASGVTEEKAKLFLLDLKDAIPRAKAYGVGNPGSQSIYHDVAIADLSVVDEWRASAAPSNGRVRALRPH